MALTLLQMVQQATGELGIPQPTQVVGASDDTALQLLALSIREGVDFSQNANHNGGWQKLDKEYSFTTQGLAVIIGNVTLGSTLITGLATTAGIVVGMTAMVNGSPTNSTVVSIDSATQVTMSAIYTQTLTGASITFGFDNYVLPTDFGSFLTGTWWDGSYRWQLMGPLTPQEKDVIKYGISPVGPRRRFWVRNNRFYIQPVPGNSTDVIYYEYYSNAWCQSSGGAPQSTWLSDTDTYLLSEECFILGLKMRYLQAKGLNYSQEAQDYMRAKDRALAADGGMRDIPINAQAPRDVFLISDMNVSDTGYGQ